jgi:hypothetical protein
VCVWHELRDETDPSPEQLHLGKNDSLPAEIPRGGGSKFINLGG